MKRVIFLVSVCGAVVVAAAFFARQGARLAGAQALPGATGEGFRVSEREQHPRIDGRTVLEPDDGAARPPGLADPGQGLAPAEPVTRPRIEAGGFRDTIELDGVPFSQLELDAMPFDELQKLRKVIGRQQSRLMSQVRGVPPAELDLYTPLEAEAANLRWGTDYLTFYNHEGETYILRLERGRFPEVYELASMVEEICATDAYSDFLEGWRSDFEATARAEHEGTELVFLTNFDGSAIYAYRADDVGGEIVAAISRPKHQ